MQLVGWGELANPNKNNHMNVNVGFRTSTQPTGYGLFGVV